MSTYTARVVLAIFALTYLGIAAGRVPGLRLNRTGIALLGAISIMIFSGVPTTAAVGFINWPTVLLLFSFFVLSAQLRLSGFFDKVANGISVQLGNPARFLLILMLVTAGLSAFLNNDIVCFVFAPVVATALVRRHLNPVPFLIALAIASNIGAAATLVGNAQDMMIAQVAGLDFGRYMLWCITPVLFALGCAYALIWTMSRHNLAFTAPMPASVKPSSRPFNRPHTIKGLVIFGLVIAFFFSSVPKETGVVYVTVRGDRRIPSHGLWRTSRAVARACRGESPFAAHFGRGNGRAFQPDQQLRGGAAAGEGGEASQCSAAAASPHPGFCSHQRESRCRRVVPQCLTSAFG